VRVCVQMCVRAYVCVCVCSDDLRLAGQSSVEPAPLKILICKLAKNQEIDIKCIVHKVCLIIIISITPIN